MSPAERVGSTVGGKYRLDGVIGEGGMGVVYVGAHAWTGREVAVKVLSQELARDRDLVGRFMQEARAAGQLSHKNVVEVYDMGADPDGTVYMVLELLRGETLCRRLEQVGKLSLQDALHLLAPVMGALATAHLNGIVHRDVKPDNVFLSVKSDDRVVPKLLDFGVAKLAQTEVVQKTRAGLILGTPSYMAPEQALGLPTVGPHSDVWSMGVVWYQCLSGVLPFDGPSPTAVLLAVTSQRAAPLATHVSLPAAICAAIDRSLEPDPAKRHATMDEMLRELLGAAAAAGLEVPEVAVIRPRSEARAGSAAGPPSGRFATSGSGPPSGGYPAVQGPPSGGYPAVQGPPSGGYPAVQRPSSGGYPAVQGPSSGGYPAVQQAAHPQVLMTPAGGYPASSGGTPSAVVMPPPAGFPSLGELGNMPIDEGTGTLAAPTPVAWSARSSVVFQNPEPARPGWGVGKIVAIGGGVGALVAVTTAVLLVVLIPKERASPPSVSPTPAAAGTPIPSPPPHPAVPTRSAPSDLSPTSPANPSLASSANPSLVAPANPSLAAPTDAAPAPPPVAAQPPSFAADPSDAGARERHRRRRGASGSVARQW